MRPVAAYLRSLDPRLPRPVYVLELGALVNAFGNGVVLPFLLIYLHNVRGIPFGLAGTAAAVQWTAALASGFLGGTLSDRLGGRSCCGRSPRESTTRARPPRSPSSRDCRNRYAGHRGQNR